MPIFRPLPAVVRTAFSVFCCLGHLSAQSPSEPCATDWLHQQALQQPGFQKKHAAYEQEILLRARNATYTEGGGGVVTLPVVVHIVHQNGAENITDAQVIQGIQQLNEAYANTGYYDQGSGVNTMIQFCLARRTPDDLATTGITRDQNPLTDMVLETQDLALKNLNRWDPTRYVNIWLVKEICSSSSGCGVAGYAYFPSAHGSNIDGIVMEARWLGTSPGNTGVLAHEMGHYLGLYHTFQGGCKNDDCLVDGDKVCDTPPDNSTLWVPCDAQVNTCSTDAQSGFTTDQNDMILNFMDYTDFKCFHDFTPGQSSRMNATLMGIRASLLDSKGCADPCPLSPVVAGFTPAGATIPLGQSISFVNTSQNAASYTWLIDGVPFSTLNNPNYTFSAEGVFQITLQANSSMPGLCSAGEAKAVIQVVCPVVADFEASTLNPAAGQSVSFTNTSQNATQYEWFVDGVSKGAALNSFTFSQTGVYIVRLDAGNGLCKKSKFRYIAVVDSCTEFTFQKIFGTTGAYEQGFSVALLADSTILTAGYVYEVDGDVFLMKTDLNGVPVWTKRFGQAGAYDAPGNGYNDLCPTSDGGFIMLFTSTAGGTPRNIGWAKFDADGNVLWQRRLNTNSSLDVIYRCRPLPDGGFMLTGGLYQGGTNTAAYLARLDAAGNQIWARCFDGPESEIFSDVTLLPDGSWLAVGFSHDGAKFDGLITRIAANGNTLWSKTLSGENNNLLRTITPLPDGNFLVSGSTNSYNGPVLPTNDYSDGWLLKINPAGQILWSKLYRPSNPVDMSFMSVTPAANGQFVFSANSSQPFTNALEVAAFLRVDADGQLIWSRQYAGTGKARLRSVTTLPGDHFALTGQSGSIVTNTQLNDLLLLKTDAGGLAGLCPEVPHTIQVIDTLPDAFNLTFSKPQAPAPVNADLAVSPLSSPVTEPCPKACDDPDPLCTSFQNTYGTASSDRGIVGIEMPGGGYLIGGNTIQNGNQHVLLIRTGANGQVLWSKRYTTSANVESLFDLQARPDGGFLMSFTFGNPSDAAFALCDANGNVQFSKHITTPSGSQTDVFYDILPTADGGYLAAGAFSPTGNTAWATFFLKMDAAGATQWYRAWDANRTDFVTGVRELPGGGYIACGYGNSFGLGGPHDGVAYRLDATGNLLWTKAYGTPVDGGFSDVAIADDGGFLFAAGLWNFGAGNYPEGGIARTDADGNLLWTKLYRPSNNLDWEPAGLVNTADGNFALAGRNRPNTGDTKAYLLKIDAAGQLLWSRQYGGGGIESLSDVRALSAGGLLWTGRTTSAGSGGEDFYVLKTDADGYAGLCPETPHTTTIIPIQLTQTNGALQEIAPPALNNLNLAVQAESVTKTEICTPDCTPDPPCENTWIQTFSTPGLQQGGTNIIQAADGNFIVSGFRNDSSLLMKLTPTGAPLWVRTFKFSSGVNERINQIIEDSEGHIAGCGMFGQGPFNGFTFRYNPAGNLVDWAFENPADPQSLYFTIQEKAPGGNFIATNSYHNSPPPGSFDDAHWVEINRNTGQFVGAPFAFTFGSSEGILDMQQRGANWYTVGRYTDGAALDRMRAALSCFDLQGNVLWSRLLFFDQATAARNYAVDFAFDGADMVTVVYGDFNGSNAMTNEIAVAKTDPNGNIRWAKRYALPQVQALAKSIVAVPNGYVVLAAEQSAGQTPNLCLLHLDKNGNVLWARQFAGYRIIRGEKLMTIAGNYLYLTAQHLGAGDLALVKIRISDGYVGNNCQQPANAAITVANLPMLSSPVNLIRYPSPIVQAARNVPARSASLTATNVCIEVCTPEICNNGLDDDGDNLIDCLDTDCDCHSCDGSETTNWYFGRQSGLDFSADPPQVLTDGKTNTNEATAVASDPLGRLIFYTDAQTIYQRNHAPMPNGAGLFGHKSSSQAIIVPHPGNPALFYVFTPDSYDNGPLRGLSYTVVDMKLNSGLGDVPAGQKNLPLTPAGELVEQITAVRHCNGQDYWVLNHRKTSNTFLAFLIDQNGLNTTPVLSNAGTGGPAPNGNYDVIGQMKASPEGLHLARALYHTNAVEVFDFDAATGVASNPLLLKAAGMINPYGIEFSPSGRYLYATGLGNPASLFQFDLLAGDAAAVEASAVQLAAFPGTYHYGQLQLAKNGKIYTTNSGPGVFTTQMGIVHFPDVAGTACLYQENGQSLTGTPGVNLGLPGFMVSYFWKPAIWFDEENTVDTICQLPSAQTYSLEKLPCGIQSVEWTLNGPGTILNKTKESVTVRFDQDGKAELIARGLAECGEVTDTLTVTVLPPSNAVLELGPDRILCDNGVSVLDAGPGFKQYRWSDGSDGQTTTTTTMPGKYWVDVWDACGNKQSDTLRIDLAPNTVLDLGPDPKICNGTTLNYPLPAPFVSWRWYPDDYLSCADCPTVSTTAPASTTYIVIGQTAGGCLSADTLTIQQASDTIQVDLELITCIGQAVVFNGQNLLPGGPYPFAFTAANGCDSTILVTVVETDSLLSSLQLKVCPGEPAVFNGQNLLPGGPYPFAFTAANGCDSTILVTVVETDSALSSLQLKVCPGEPAVFNGQNLLPGGPYPFAFTAANGCDSTILVTVVERDSALSSLQLKVCPGEPAVFNGQNLLPGGPYPFAFTAANGCDSTILVTVVETDSALSSLQLKVCPGEPAVFNGQNLLPGGPYPFAFTAANGCDSTILVTVVETDSMLSQVLLPACPGQNTVFNGQILLPGGPYPFTFTAANGCDSTILVTVVESDSALTSLYLTTCAGQPAVYNGKNLAPGGPYPFVFTAANGCDSTVLVSVLEMDSALIQVVLASCPGSPAVYNGKKLSPGGPYPFVYTAANGCDSTILVTVSTLNGVTVELPPVLQTNLGDPVQLVPLLTGAAPFQYSWTPVTQLSCSACSDPFAAPVSNTWYTLQVTDTQGCMGVDSVWVRVRPVCEVYLPNAFQPSADGPNSRFYPQTAACIRLVRLMRVYSRWGELVFERRDFEPNIEAMGWDGQFRQQPLAPGVFAWYAEFELSNGESMMVQGDVTIVR